MASATIIRATESFSFLGPNGPVSVKKGSTFHKDSTLLEGLSDEALGQNFVPFEPDHGVERATAAPGERRKGGPRRGKAAEADKAGDEATPQGAVAEEGGEDAKAADKADE